MEQDDFDKAVGGVIAQGGFARDENGNCFYRGEGGLKCAIGQLIPDSAYTPEMEGKGAGTALDMAGMAGMACRVRGAEAYRWLQAAHDFAVDMDDFKLRAKGVAVEFDLEWNFGD